MYTVHYCLFDEYIWSNYLFFIFKEGCIPTVWNYGALIKQEKMTQEEDDLEEELRNLDIREDHGAEDSDVTPTNTPPSSPPILYIKKYPPSQPIGYQENKDFER